MVRSSFMSSNHGLLHYLWEDKAWSLGWMFTAVQDRSRERPLACVNTYTRDAVDPIDTMTSSGQAASLSLSKGDKPERENDLAFLDNIDELNANWPDYQVRASLQTCACSSAGAASAADLHWVVPLACTNARG